MTRRQVGMIIAFVVCSAVLVAAPVMGLSSPPPQVDNSTNTTNGSFGQQISSFMQASAVDVNTSVRSGMWQASVNQTIGAEGDPASKVTSRTTQLERELQRLQNKSERLQAKRDQLPEVAYTARASALREQIANLKDDINSTAKTATRVGVNTSQLDRLRTVAGNTTGPEIGAIVRNITDVPRGPPADVPGGGPPEDIGPGNGSPPVDRTPPNVDPANQSDGNFGNSSPPASDTQTPPGAELPTNQTVEQPTVSVPGTNQTVEQPTVSVPTVDVPGDGPSEGVGPGNGNPPSDETPTSVDPANQSDGGSGNGSPPTAGDTQTPPSAETPTKQPVERPTEDLPGTNQPTEEPVEDLPDTNQPVEQPTEDAPGASQTVEQPTVNVPGTEQPVEQPPEDVPSANQPVGESPDSAVDTNQTNGSTDIFQPTIQ